MITKTEEKLYLALEELLNTKKYNDIVVQDILDISKVSRGTFYAHFKNKEDLLLSIVTNIFDHCFKKQLDKEKTHDFKNSSIFDYKAYLTHILYHFKDQSSLINSILNSDIKDIFLDKIRVSIKPIIEKIVQEKLINNKIVPYKLNLEIANENFIVIIKHWFNHNLEAIPETIASYYYSLIFN